MPGVRFDVTAWVFWAVMERGSVPSYPSRDADRAAAGKAGNSKYLGKPCSTHGTQERFTCDASCIECMDEHGRRDEEKKATK